MSAGSSPLTSLGSRTPSPVGRAPRTNDALEVVSDSDDDGPLSAALDAHRDKRSRVESSVTAPDLVAFDLSHVVLPTLPDAPDTVSQAMRAVFAGVDFDQPPSSAPSHPPDPLQPLVDSDSVTETCVTDDSPLADDSGVFEMDDKLDSDLGVLLAAAMDGYDDAGAVVQESRLDSDTSYGDDEIWTGYVDDSDPEVPFVPSEAQLKTGFSTGGGKALAAASLATLAHSGPGFFLSPPAARAPPHVANDPPLSLAFASAGGRLLAAPAEATMLERTAERNRSSPVAKRKSSKRPSALARPALPQPARTPKESIASSSKVLCSSPTHESTSHLDGSPAAFVGFTAGGGRPVRGASAAMLQQSNARLAGTSAPVLYAPLSAAAHARSMALVLSSPPAGDSAAAFAGPIPVFAGFGRPTVGGRATTGDVFGMPAAGPAEDETFGAVGRDAGDEINLPVSSSIGLRVPLVEMDANSNLTSPLPSAPLDPSTSSPVRRARLNSSPGRDLTASTTPAPKVPHLALATPRFRAPMLSTTRTPLASTSVIPVRPRPATVKSSTTTFRAPMLNSASKNTPLRPAPAMRRLNFGMTPHSRTVPRLKFNSPSMNGIRPVGLTPVSSVANAGTAGRNGKGKEAQTTPAVRHAVFDLKAAGPRLGLAEYGVLPQAKTFEELSAIGLPVDLLSMNSVLAKTYLFPCGRGQADALRALDEANCAPLESHWVKNHWALIVWKLASLVRSKPDELPVWRWETVLDQLKYRFEREINHAQRSCIKRVQERDSSAALPMVLCVSQIRWAQSQTKLDDSSEPAPPVIVGLELTDGWYRIRAKMDVTLTHACARGKIMVGTKLQIFGARLDSGRDGMDVLEALESSILVISGNSTALAQWDETLGFTKRVFTASLDSLTPGGGVAPLLDIVVNRVFPYGYIDMAKNGSHGMWNEEEEAQRADQWIRGREAAKAQLAEQLEKDRDESEVLRDLLQDATESAGPSTATDEDLDDEDAADILDRIEDAENKRAVIRRLSVRQIHECLRQSGENVERARYSAIAELEKELTEQYPPRDVRGFRVMRISDASDLKPTSRVRTALLTVWDANNLGPEFLQVGQRYLVSNVLPKGSWARSSSEITLATRRDSHWRVKSYESNI